MKIYIIEKIKKPNSEKTVSQFSKKRKTKFKDFGSQHNSMTEMFRALFKIDLQLGSSLK